MTVNQDTIGVLSLAHPEIVQIDGDTFRWIESLANYLALITHRKQLEASLRQANIELGIQVAAQTTELRGAIAQLQQEICDRQQTEAALRESEERFRRIFDHAPIGIAVARVTDYQFLMINQAFCQFLGYTEVELLTHSCLSISYPDDQNKDQPLALQMLSGEINSYQIEKRYLKKNQQLIWASLTATAVRDPNGEVLYVVCCKHLQEPLPTSYFCVPMAAQGETSGVLYLSLPTQPLSDAKQQLATTVEQSLSQLALPVFQSMVYPARHCCKPLTWRCTGRKQQDAIALSLRFIRHRVLK